MSRKPQAAPHQDDEFDPDEIREVIDEYYGDNSAAYVHSSNESNLHLAKAVLRKRRRMDELCDLADIPYSKRERYKSTVHALIEEARDGKLFGWSAKPNLINADMTEAAKKMREAHEAIAALSEEQIRALSDALKLSAEGTGTWVEKGLEAARKALFYRGPYDEFDSYDSEEEIVLNARIPLDILSALSKSFIKLTDRKPEPRSAGTRGRPKGDVAGNRFRTFVSALWAETNKAGGWLSLSRPQRSNVAKGKMPDVLELLRPDLPENFVPAPLSAAILEEIQGSVPVKRVRHTGRGTSPSRGK
jgi:hypothetical protein